MTGVQKHSEHHSSVEVAPVFASDVTWLAPVPQGYRRIRAAIAFGVGFLLAACLAFVQWTSGMIGQAESLWGLALLLAGTLRAKMWLRIPDRRMYATVEVPVAPLQRAKKAYPLWLLGFGGCTTMWGLQWGMGYLSQEWLLGLAFLPFGLLGIFIFVFLKKERILTPEAAKARHYINTAPQSPVELDNDPAAEHAPSLWEKRLNALGSDFSQSKSMRYSAAGLLLWFAYLIAQHEKPLWVAVGMLALAAVWCAREVAVWIAGLAAVVGIGWLLIAGLAALPISAAIIVGALIIAGSLRK